MNYRQSGHVPALFGDPGGLRQGGKPLPIVGGGFPLQMQLDPGQANRAQHLAAQLPQTGDDMLDAVAQRGDALVAPLLSLGRQMQGV